MNELNLEAFKAYDIRTKITALDGKLKQRLYNSVVYYLQNSLKARGVVICHDARLHVPEMAQAVSEISLLCGIDVYMNPQPVSTCQFYHSAMKHPDCAAIMMTASHNPAEYIGMKLLEQEMLPLAYGYGTDGGVQKIRENYQQDRKPAYTAQRGKLTIIDDLDSYISYCLALSGVKPGSLKGEKIMLEFLSGSAGHETALAFQETGADLVLGNTVPNGFFPSGDPNPIIESSIAPTRKKMVEQHCSFGFSFDGDGDRLDLMAPDGSQIIPGYNMAILIPEINRIYAPLLKGRKPQYFADVKAIPDALIEMAKKDVGVHIIRNGHSFIKAKLRENASKGFLAAEEESAHYYLNLPYDLKDLNKGTAAAESTLFYALLSAKCWHRNPEQYIEAQKKANRLFRKREWPLHCESHKEILQPLMKQVQHRMEELGASVITKMDDGSDLDATLMRFNLPEYFNKHTTLPDRWVQVAERISRSEDAMIRWEVVSNTKEGCEKMNKEITLITDTYVEQGMAHY